MSQLWQWYSEGRLKPYVDRVFPLERAAEALTLMATRSVQGKIVLTVVSRSAGLWSCASRAQG